MLGLMNSVLIRIIVFVSLLNLAESCELYSYPESKCDSWGSCTETCGGGRTSRICRLCIWGLTKRFYQNCNEFCYHGYTYNGGRCHCPEWRTGRCCDACRKIAIAHCVSDVYKECGGSPDGIRCTKCQDPYYPAGYNLGCKECPNISHCVKRHCSNPSSTLCAECQTGFYLDTKTGHCVGCLIVPHCAGWLSCSSANDTKCDHCEEGFYLENDTGLCKECGRIEHCLRHSCATSVNTTCNECESSYALDSGHSKCEDLYTKKDRVCTSTSFCFIIYEVQKDWNTSKDVCEARNLQLFVPRDLTEDLIVEHHLETMRGVYSDHHVFWMGGTVKMGTQTAVWLDNSTLQFARWSWESNPANISTMCMGFYADQHFFWEMFPCDMQAFFICKERTPGHPGPAIIG